MQISRREDRCNTCMLCVRDCAYGVWQIVEGMPAVVDAGACNLCSHCIAVCPQDAIIHDGLLNMRAKGIDREKLNADVYREIVMSRRSIRHFKNKAVSRDMIADLLDLARYAPTSSNDQNVGYMIITDKNLIENTGMDVFGYASRFYDRSQKGVLKFIVRMTGLSNNRYFKRIDFAQKKLRESGRDPILYGAPVLLLLHTPKDARFGVENCTISATTIINHAHSLGLGTCFVGYLTLALKYSKKLRDQLQIPKDRRVNECLVIGYPAYKHTGMVSRKKPDMHWV